LQARTTSGAGNTSVPYRDHESEPSKTQPGLKKLMKLLFLIQVGDANLKRFCDDYTYDIA